MRDFVVGTLMLSSGVWASLGFYHADFGMLIIAVVFTLLLLTFILAEFIYKKWILSRLPKFVAISYGDEWFLKDERGVMHPSYRKEVSDLMLSGQITKFE
jgi:hypothetical protein